MIKKIKCIHRGQYKAYGDSYYIYLINSDLTDSKEVAKECLQNNEITNIGVNEKATIRDTVKRWWANDMETYFNGCCCVEKYHDETGEYNYEFTYLLPYDD